MTKTIEKILKEFDDFWTKRVGKYAALKDKIRFKSFLSVFLKKAIEETEAKYSKEIAKWMDFVKTARKEAVEDCIQELTLYGFNSATEVLKEKLNEKNHRTIKGSVGVIE